MDNLKLLADPDKIGVVTREKSYKVNHLHTPFDNDPNLGRKEDRMARSFMGKPFEGLGVIIDYQTPLY